MLTQMISFPGEGRTLHAYTAVPDGGAAPDGGRAFPGVLVIHEAYGLNENIRDIARRFASQGYAALALDLFSERSQFLCMFRLFRAMSRDSLDHEGVRDLKKGLSQLAALPGVDAERLGAVGYCLGGGLAIALGCADRRLKAVAPYYGVNPKPADALARSCPVVGSYPGKDFTTAHGRALDAALDEYAVPHDIKIYEGAGHSFFNDTSRRAYHPAAAEDSWRRVLSFFDRYVRDVSTPTNS